MGERDPSANDIPRDLPRVRYWELERGRAPETRRIGSEFDRLIRELAPTVRPRRRSEESGAAEDLERLRDAWQRAVGEEIAAVSRPGRFRGGVLTVEVDSAPLAAELEQFARDHLLEALEREGLVGLCELRFRGGRTEHDR